MDEVIRNFFGDERIRYYSPGDNIHANHYVRYRKDDGVILSVGSDEGEVDLLKTDNPHKLQSLIQAIIYC